MPVCRICFQCNPDGLIEPCECQGTTSKVHKNCLEFSLIGLGSLRCEICSFDYKIEMVPKYQFCESIRIWAKERLLNSENIYYAILYFICGLLYIVAWIIDNETDLFKTNFFKYWCMFVSFFYVISMICLVVIFYLDWSSWKRFQVKISLIPRANIRIGIDIINAQIDAEMNL